MYKKILAICLSVVLAMSAAVTPVFADNDHGSNKKNDNRGTTSSISNKEEVGLDDLEDILKYFLDSDDVEWALKSIEKMGAMGVLKGDKGKFKPKSNVTHAEAIAMVLRLTGQDKKAEAIQTQPEYFKGLCDRWSYGYLQYALDNGIIIPEEDGKFNPKTPAKRHEIAKYIVRALGRRSEALANMDKSLSFTDASAIPRNSIGYVYVVTKLGIMTGNKNEFQPNKPITRAEMAVILDRAEDKFDDVISSDNESEGTFLSYDSANSRITIKTNNQDVVYNVIPNVPVYKNNTYYTISVLQPGDVIEIVLDSSNRVIFIEFKDLGTTPVPTGEQLAVAHVEYSNLPVELQTQIDTLKLTENYTAFRKDNYIYLVASKGQAPTGGYNINIKQVYKDPVTTGKYNLRAVVEKTYPSGLVVTQGVTYPVDIVRFAYFDGINKVNFMDTTNALLAATTLNQLDNQTTVTGRINSVDTSNRIIYIKDANNQTRAYYITSNAEITLNNTAIALSALAENMPVTITINNGYATRIAAQNVDSIQSINGTITSVDTTNRIIYLKDTNNMTRAYYIASNAEITLNSAAVALSALTANMPVSITVSNGYATRIAAQSAESVETISGRITNVDITNRILYVRESDNVLRAYYIPTRIQITLAGRAVALSALRENMPVVITKTNGNITKVAAENAEAVETNTGKIGSVDASNRIIYLADANNVTRAYYIPANAEITLQNTAVALTALTANMPVTITRTNNNVTKVAAQNAVRIETINGKINSVDASNRILYLKESDNVVRAYYIATNVQITLDNRTVALSALNENMTATITRTDDVITHLAAQTVADTETINGRISTIDSANRILSVKESDNVIRSYYIPTNVQITLNNTAVALTALLENMTVAITRANGEITKVAATQLTQTISGTLDSVDAVTRTVRILESNNALNTYTIPESAQILLNNQTANLSNYTKGMKVDITKVDGVITRISAQNDVQVIEGVLINVYPSTNNSSISVKVGNSYRLFVLIPETAVFYNNQSYSIANMPLNITITIRMINGIVTEVRNK